MQDDPNIKRKRQTQQEEQTAVDLIALSPVKTPDKKLLDPKCSVASPTKEQLKAMLAAQRKRLAELTGDYVLIFCSF